MYVCVSVQCLATFYELGKPVYKGRQFVVREVELPDQSDVHS
jgi:hypothetical protein